MARIIVIGGSLGGLLAANLCHLAGHDVVLLERAVQALDGRGAGIVTHPQLLGALKRAGVPADAALGISVRRRVALDAQGAIIASREQPQLLTGWGHLYALLKAAFPASQYRTAISVERVEQTATGVTAHTAEQSFTGDLVIASDGLRSTIRRQFEPETIPLYAGYVAWRGVCDEAALSERTRATLFDHFGFGLPEGEQIIGYPVTGANNESAHGKRRYNYVWYRPAHGHAAIKALLTDSDGMHHPHGIPPQKIQQKHVDDMRRAARKLLAPQFAEIVEKTMQPFLQPIFDVASKRIAFGRVALMGDASFVARPHVGMGVTKAAKDAMALIDCISEFGATPHALARYEVLRLASGSAIVDRGRALGRYLQSHQSADSFVNRRDPHQVLRDTAIDPDELDNEALDAGERVTQGG